MIKEAIILAGGLGTRLRDTVPDLPKCMAPVAGQPFLTYIIRHLLSQGIEKFVFSLGYKHEVISEFLAVQFAYIRYTCIIEDQPLGTGGAIRLALSGIAERDVLIVNGDTLFKINVDDISDLHIEKQAECTVALKPMVDFERYGVVEMNDEGEIKNFSEKKYSEQGLINGGVYVLNKNGFLKKDFTDVFSFEKDYLEQYVQSSLFCGILQDNYFIDIGIPADYEKAQTELLYPGFPFDKIDKTWTLFLDRDGVINYNKEESYVFDKSEFHFIPGSIEAIKVLTSIFGKIIIVTNQRGIGKGLMNEEALSSIHDHMVHEIENGGGRIDALYYCTNVDDKYYARKPNPGMLLEAAHMFEDIDFSRSVMVGDKLSDMQMGRNVGAYTVFIAGEKPIEDQPDFDMACPSLINFSMRFVH